VINVVTLAAWRAILARGRHRHHGPKGICSAHAPACLHCATILAGPAVARPVPPNLAEWSRALEDLSRRVEPSVVQILTATYATREAPAVGLIAKQRATRSGVIVYPDEFIVTNVCARLSPQRRRKG